MTDPIKNAWQDVIKQITMITPIEDFKLDQMLGRPEPLTGFIDPTVKFIPALTLTPIRNPAENAPPSILMFYTYDGLEKQDFTLHTFSQHEHEPYGSFKHMVQFVLPKDIYDNIKNQLREICQDSLNKGLMHAGVMWVTLITVNELKGEDHV